MTEGDVTAARALLELLPRGFRNTGDYRRQCDMYDSLCRQGIVERTGLLEMRNRISEILEERSDSSEIVGYADALVCHGYNARGIDACTMFTMEEAMETARMSEGHRLLFSAFAENNTPPLSRMWATIHKAVHECVPLMKRATRRSQRDRLEVLLGDADDDEESTKGDDD
jgi:hypothetical protein